MTLEQYPNADDERRRVDDPPEVYRSQSDFAPPAHLEPADRMKSEHLWPLVDSAPHDDNAVVPAFVAKALLADLRDAIASRKQPDQTEATE